MWFRRSRKRKARPAPEPRQNPEPPAGADQANGPRPGGEEARTSPGVVIGVSALVLTAILAGVSFTLNAPDEPRRGAHAKRGEPARDLPLFAPGRERGGWGERSRQAQPDARILPVPAPDGERAADRLGVDPDELAAALAEHREAMAKAREQFAEQVRELRRQLAKRLGVSERDLAGLGMIEVLPARSAGSPSVLPHCLDHPTTSDDERPLRCIYRQGAGQQPSVGAREPAGNATPVVPDGR